MQTGDTSAYATSISTILQKWGGMLYSGLVASSAADVDDAAFEHLSGKLAARFIPYLCTHGIMKCASPASDACPLWSLLQSCAARGSLQLGPIQRHGCAGSVE